MVRRLIASLLVALLVLLGPATANHMAGMAPQPDAISAHGAHHEDSCGPTRPCGADFAMCEFVCFGPARLAPPGSVLTLARNAALRFALPGDSPERADVPRTIDHPPKWKFPKPQPDSPVFPMV
jgi:hypothetical protein